MISPALVFGTLVCICIGVQLEDYRPGRGGFYGNDWQLWDVHQGSCGYGYLCPEEGTGWDIAALPDTHPDYSTSCGQCYEVKCNPKNFQDNYSDIQAVGVCKDPEASVIVTITDTYPCDNCQKLYSNMRWCCSSDIDYMDLSIWAFEKLSEIRFGVIGLSYRKVTCDHKPIKEAPEPANPFSPTPVLEETSCPKGNFKLKENWQIVQMDFHKRLENAGMASFVASALSNSDYQAKIADSDNQQQIIPEDFSDLAESGWEIYYQKDDYSMPDSYSDIQ